MIDETKLQAQREYWRLWKAKQHAKTFCVFCNVPGKWLCDGCAVERGYRRKRAGEHRKARGLCVTCNKKSAEIRCGDCKAKRLEYDRARRERLKAEGRCIHCMNRARMGRLTCSLCALKQHNTRKAREAALKRAQLLDK